MDVAIVKCKECFFSREAESHIRAFFDKLMTEDKQKMDVTLKSFDLKDLDHTTERVVVHSAKVQIVIISHHFLQRLKDEASRRPRLSPINRVFRSKNVIAVLLAVTAKDVLDSYESVLPRFREWFSVDLRSTNKYDPEFCKKFTEQVVRIYNVELSNSSNFSVFPKKVTREQPKIVIVFKKPIQPTDEVRVELSTQKHANIISENVKLENPHTTLLRIPETLSPDREAIVDVSVFVNNNKIGGSRIKSELNMRRTDEDDIDRMAKQLPPFLGWLDKHIAETLLKHYKECTDYTADPELELMNGIIICRADILPTIMHFAAYYGLQQTAFTVLDEADGLLHCDIRNELDETPSDLAFTRGHEQMGEFIVKYQDVSNSCAPAFRFLEDVPVDTTKQENTKDDDNGTPELDQNSYEDLIPENGQASQITENNNNLDIGSPLRVPDTPGSSECHFVCPDVGFVIKSDDEGVPEVKQKAPTPLTRRAKPFQEENKRIYVNIGGNPDDNPEIVQTREKKIFISPDVARRRLSILENYDLPRPRDQDYEVPPPVNRPVTQHIENGVNGPIFMAKNSQGPHVTDSGYLIMNEGLEAFDPPNASDFQENPLSAASSKPDKPERKLASQQNSESSTSSSSRDNAASPSPSQTDLLRLMNAKQNRNKTITLDPADEQLIELMNDFKNKTYDMKQVELLFENWKQRPDVQKSMEEKMKMLEKLREEYQLTQQKSRGTRKTSVLNIVKQKLTTKRKKSTTQAPSNSSGSLQRELTDNGATNIGCVSPTGLTFTGPNIPSQPFTSTTSISPANSQHGTEGSRVSEISYRTSIGSRMSDSSGDSETSRKPSPPLPPEYKNPMSKRFVPSYVLPHSAPQSTTEPGQSGPPAFPPPIPLVGTPDSSYQIPPPPRPVKPLKAASNEDLKTSPNVPRRPPVIPPEAHRPPSPPTVPSTPPAIPAKSTPKYTDTDATTPPPVPPPRTNNALNSFSFIDYKKKNQEPTDTTTSGGTKYENMRSEPK